MKLGISTIIKNFPALTGKDFHGAQTVEIKEVDSQLWDSTFESRYHDGSCGVTDRKTSAFAVMADGLKEIAVSDIWDSNYAYSQRSEKLAPTLREQLSDSIGSVVAIIAAGSVVEDWSGQKYEKYSWAVFWPVKLPDMAKIRRRVEDALRKSATEADMLEIAARLGCKLTD